MRVLITRAEPAASQSASKLRDAGFDPVVMTLFEVCDTNASIPGANHDAFVFTSSNAIHVLKGRGWSCNNRPSIAYCVGQETAENARQLGFNTVVSANGNASDLASMILKDASKGEIRALYCAGRDRSFDMHKALAGSSVRLETVEVYKIEKRFPGKSEFKEMVESFNSGIVFLYSHNTAKHVCDTLFERALFNSDSLLSALAISPKTAEAVLKYPWQGVYVADEVSEQSMIEKAAELSIA